METMKRPDWCLFSRYKITGDFFIWFGFQMMTWKVSFSIINPFHFFNSIFETNSQQLVIYVFRCCDVLYNVFSLNCSLFRTDGNHVWHNHVPRAFFNSLKLMVCPKKNTRYQLSTVYICFSNNWTSPCRYCSFFFSWLESCRGRWLHWIFVRMHFIFPVSWFRCSVWRYLTCFSKEIIFLDTFFK